MNGVGKHSEEAWMMDRTELLESALDALPAGIVVFDMEGEVVFWNRVAETITGYTGPELLGHGIPVALEPLAPERLLLGELHRDAEPRTSRGAQVRTRHKLGHELQAITRVVALRDALGGRIGTAAVFHPAESLDALPHGITGENGAVAASQADLEDRLQIEFEDYERGGQPFGVLWISVDQAQDLRKTHGSSACEAMLEKVEHALLQGLRPAEESGRWGDDEFLIISHERTTEMLGAHAQALAGLARTADFRWWGDRISLTVSIGAVQACHGQDAGLAQLLECAQKAMESSNYAGGNCITSVSWGQECSPS
jgi:diguanylate cyclase (GGDEF)-like protein/PAS domain S-box-containing protein